ncbi:ankyrin repeat domain-containing protein [Litorilituus sediminis]|nr:ankyrin repeat domain-containing protein [Litorilituus sediminis]
MILSTKTFANGSLANCIKTERNIEGEELIKVKLYLSGKSKRGEYWQSDGILAAEIGDIAFIKNSNSSEVYFDALYVALSSKPELYDEIISLFPDINERSSYGVTPLMMAVSCNRVEIVKKLISQGADVNLKVPPDNYDSLIFGVFTQNPTLVNLLIEQGANCKDSILSNGLSVLGVAEKTSTAEVVNLIKQCLVKE